MSKRAASYQSLKLLSLRLAGLFARLPLPVSSGIGSAMIAVGSLLPSRRRRRCLANLALAFPERTPEWHRATADRACLNAGREMIATLSRSYRPRAELPSICTNYAELREVVERDLAEDTGVLIVGGHIGNPPLLAALCATFAPVTGLVERYDFEPHRDFVCAARERLGLQTVPNGEWSLDLLRALQRKEVVTFLPDVPPRRNHGITVPFFGRPACTTTFPAALARLTGCAFRPLYLVREGSRYRVIIRDRIRPPLPGEGDAGLEQATLAWTRVLEEEIRARPEQWLWTMRRWLPVEASTGRSAPAEDARASDHAERRRAVTPAATPSPHEAAPLG
ncbi:MAG: lysophospholipid acyltransferase family protein [Planctomycetota bacterium]